MTKTEGDQNVKYVLTDEFRMEDLIAALDSVGGPTAEEIAKWRAEEETRQALREAKYAHERWRWWRSLLKRVKKWLH